MVMFFYFKQKTAYEMRISDWSSDVCSSDLDSRGRGLADRQPDGNCALCAVLEWPCHQSGAVLLYLRGLCHRRRGQCGELDRRAGWLGHNARHHRQRCLHADSLRSEEHTSELQSLMRRSYADFCLKKKKNT